MDPRIQRIAENITNYSVAIKPGEKVLIQNTGKIVPLTKELIRQTYKLGGIPFVTIKDNELLRVLLSDCTEEQIKKMAEYELNRMKEMDVYIGITSVFNANEMISVPEENMKMYQEYFMKPVYFEQRCRYTKWCILKYPNQSMAQLANMSTELFEDYYFKVCAVDYAKMSKAMDQLVALMTKTDKIRISGNGTDITFSIKGMPIGKCDGKLNIPDGEVYTAPIRDSVNGTIAYNVSTEYYGFTFENIKLEFRDGQIVNATSNNSEKMNKIFDTDLGARYIGEFALGCNPYINHPIKDTSFDEKIHGSIHLTPGDSYDECDNGNHSAIHWDLVLIQRSDYGGGEIWFDDILVRKDGLFVLEEIECLNPDNLRGPFLY